MSINENLSGLQVNPFDYRYSPAGMLEEVLSYLPGTLGREAPDTILKVMRRFPCHGGAESAAAELGLKVVKDAVMNFPLFLGTWYQSNHDNLSDVIRQKEWEIYFGVKDAFKYWVGASKHWNNQGKRAVAAVAASTVILVGVSASNLASKVTDITQTVMRGAHYLLR